MKFNIWQIWHCTGLHHASEHIDDMFSLYIYQVSVRKENFGCLFLVWLPVHLWGKNVLVVIIVYMVALCRGPISRLIDKLVLLFMVLFSFATPCAPWPFKAGMRIWKWTISVADSLRDNDAWLKFMTERGVCLAELDPAVPRLKYQSGHIRQACLHIGQHLANNVAPP